MRFMTNRGRRSKKTAFLTRNLTINRLLRSIRRCRGWRSPSARPAFPGNREPGCRLWRRVRVCEWWCVRVRDRPAV